MKEVWKNASGMIGAIIAALVIMAGISVIGYTAVSTISGLAVAQSTTTWNSVIDAAKGDTQASGILGSSPYLFNGISFDRQRGTSGSANVNIVGATTPSDAFANPTTTTPIWSLTGLFNGTTWDRQRTATADALASTGIPAVGNMTFNGSTWDRWKGQTFPVQGTNLFNTQTTGAATTAVTVTLTALANARVHVYEVEGRCNTAANTSGITITDGGTTIWSTVATEVLAANNFVRTWPTGLTAATNSQVVITLAACAAGTGTLIVQADKF